MHFVKTCFVFGAAVFFGSALFSVRAEDRAAAIPSYFSPDGKVALRFFTHEKLTYTISVDGKELIHSSELSLQFAESRARRSRPLVKSRSYRSVDRMVNPANPLWHSALVDRFNEVTLDLGGGVSLVARIADDGVAMHFVVEKAQAFILWNEIFETQVSAAAKLTAAFVDCAMAPQNLDCFQDSYEHTFPTIEAAAMRADWLAQLPLLVEENGYWLAIGETDVVDYPGAWLRSGGDANLAFVSPRAPKTLVTDAIGPWNFEAVEERQDYLAEYPAGTHRFPWRIIQIGRAIGDLIGRDFPARLADSNSDAARARDYSWVRTGFTTDEWIIGSSLEIDPNTAGFVPGLNTPTYKYYIDFAARLDFPYIIIDDGWANPNDMQELNPDVDLPELVRYGRERGVGIILWAESWMVRQDISGVLDRFQKLGVVGIEIDFHQRDDIDMIRFHETILSEAAARKLLVSFHGCSKPAGLQFKYPNLIAVEAGLGHEYNKGSNIVSPRHKLDLAFIRTLSGLFDYEGGSMINRQPEYFQVDNLKVQAQGTRVNEMALSILYPSPLQVIGGDPAQLQADANMVDYFRGLPSTWDETQVLAAEFGKYLVVAKRKGERWYFAGISALDAPIDLVLDISSLGLGPAVIDAFADGPSADARAEDYRREMPHIDGDGKIRIHLARNGGWIGRTN